jgi:hypothetical protein
MLPAVRYRSPAHPASIEPGFPVERNRAAREYLEKSQMFGKIVLTP